jgi:hypothetical protein
MIGKQKLSVKVVSYSGKQSIYITEHVKNAMLPYRASLTEALTKKQALALGLLLIKAAQS